MLLLLTAFHLVSIARLLMTVLVSWLLPRALHTRMTSIVLLQRTKTYVSSVLTLTTSKHGIGLVHLTRLLTMMLVTCSLTLALARCLYVMQVTLRGKKYKLLVTSSSILLAPLVVLVAAQRRLTALPIGLPLAMLQSPHSSF